MKKILAFTTSFLATFFSIIPTTCTANYYDPRVTVWGLAGTPEDVRGDALFPLLSNLNQLLYLDLQGNYTTPGSYSSHADRSDASYLSAGAGFRRLYSNSKANAIVGAYFFYDRDRSVNHNTFHVLSPGVEGLFCDWDVHVNGYFPLNPRKTLKSVASQFPCDCADCTNCANCLQAVFFQGHSQFGHRYSFLEQAGRGGDAEVGYTIRRLRNTQVHGGVYYFNFNTPSNSWNFHNNPNNLTGVEGRLETPVNRQWALTVEASYDKYQHGAVLGGLRYTPFAPKHPYDLRSRMLDPIPRNLGTFQTGSGVPTIRAKHDQGIFLQRSNIYFFSATGGSAFANPSTSGTFENPLSNDQMTQLVVDQIGNGANFYIPTGTYVLGGSSALTGPSAAPNINVTLLPGDSIYGRMSNGVNPYLLAATGDARPVLLGALTLTGNNTLASMQLINSGVSDGTTNASFTALTIPNAPNIFMCNDNIVGKATVNGDLQAGATNIATGIFAHNSQIFMKNSTVSADAVVTGTIAGEDKESGLPGGANLAAGMGMIAVPTITSSARTASSSGDFSGNTITILTSTVNGSASSATTNGVNSAVGIGAIVDNGGTANFDDNTFFISHGNINSSATTSENNFGNAAAGIGVVRIFNNSGSAEFKRNNFDLQFTPVISKSVVNQDNNNQNVSIGIGNSNANFESNTFNLNNSSQSSSAIIGGLNSSEDTVNSAIGVGAVGSASFNANTFRLSGGSLVYANATVGQDNEALNSAIGIGAADEAEFASNNNFMLANSGVSATASVGGSNNGATNFATGIGTQAQSNFSNNTFTLAASNINATATVSGDNQTRESEEEKQQSLNGAVGIGSFGSSGPGFASNSFQLSDCPIIAKTSIGGNNLGVQEVSFNSAIGIGDFFSSQDTNGFAANSFTLSNSSVTANSDVTGSNSGAISVATGIGGLEESNFQGNRFTLSNNSNVNASAKIHGENDGINEAIGIGDSEGANFTGNRFTLLSGSSVSANASVDRDNNGMNFATGIGVGPDSTNFTGNIFQVNNNAVTAIATIFGNNNAGALNSAVGIGNNSGNPTTSSFANNIVTGDTNVAATDSVKGINDGTSQSHPEDLSFPPPQFMSDKLAELIGINNTTDQSIYNKLTSKVSDSTSLVIATVHAVKDGTNQRQKEELNLPQQTRFDIMIKEPEVAIV